MSIKDGRDWHVLAADKVELDGPVVEYLSPNVQASAGTWVVEMVGTTNRNIHLGVTPNAPSGYYIHKVEWRYSTPEMSWRKASHSQGRYKINLARKSFGDFQVEVRVIYRPAIERVASARKVVVVDSERPKYGLEEHDRVDLFLVPVRFAHDLCDLY
ncbi:MAG: hypothetical protein Q8Q20_03295 [bacterium]|nr:hypothetical protein [bacterium]